MNLPKKQGQRLIPEYLLKYNEELHKNHPDPSAEWGGSGSEYTAGEGIDITNNTISIDDTVALKEDIITSYNDLTDKPTIPTVNDATITITQGGVTKGSFTLNQSSGDTIALDAGGSNTPIVTLELAQPSDTGGTLTQAQYDTLLNNPEAILVIKNRLTVNSEMYFRQVYNTVLTSELIYEGTPVINGNNSTIDAGFVVIDGTHLTYELDGNTLTVPTNLATVATTGDYNDLTNKPTFATVATSGDYDDLSNKPTLFSGNYNDLTNKPDLSIYAQSANLATVATTGSYNDLTNKPTIPTVPTRTLLWSRTPDSGTSTTGITTLNLSDDATKYDYIEVFFNTNDNIGRKGIVKLESPTVNDMIYLRGFGLNSTATFQKMTIYKLATTTSFTYDADTEDQIKTSPSHNYSTTQAHCRPYAIYGWKL